MFSKLQHHKYKRKTVSLHHCDFKSSTMNRNAAILFSTFILAIYLASAPSLYAETNRNLVDLSSFVPIEILANLERLPADTRARVCQGDANNLQKLNIMEPEASVRGLSSNMVLNGGAKGKIDTFAAYVSEAMLAAYVRGSDNQKVFILKLLARWANAGAYTRTIQCNDNGACGGEWNSHRGMELAPKKDFDTVQERMMPIYFSYYTTLSGYKRSEYKAEHEIIERWLAEWPKRIWPAQKSTNQALGFGFGLQWQLWAMPVVDLKNGDRTTFIRRMRNVSNRLDALINVDGSLKERTTRGSRAAWYHFTSLGEVFFALEMLNANNMDQYHHFRDRLDRSVGIFLDTMDDVEAGRNNARHPAAIYRWAKNDYRSAGEPSVQDFYPSMIRDMSSWIYVYIYRFPDGINTPRLRKLVSKVNRQTNVDNLNGLAIGCLYRLMDPKLLAWETSSTIVAEKFLNPIDYDLNNDMSEITNLNDEIICMFSMKIDHSGFSDEGKNIKYVKAAKQKGLDAQLCRALLDSAEK